MNNLVIYPGTFDPITYGHIDIIRRTKNIFKNIIVAVIDKPNFKTMFNLKERKNLLKESTKNIKNILILSFNDLIVNFASSKKVFLLIRGIRDNSDLNYEMNFYRINKILNKKVETIFLFSSNKFSYVSSSIIKEISYYGGNVKKFVPKNVCKALSNKIKSLKKKNK
ncbi:pantetheine-phosphate adenylyltransferase [Buchnera aphidicola (Taiwanaphis decaspermi)]|uniref:pantetheine-phosphate adenylyltransferase n=1 Tax=Buchnera aphidicola TaxID=9 RepID=UPI0031B86E8B